MVGITDLVSKAWILDVNGARVLKGFWVIEDPIRIVTSHDRKGHHHPWRDISAPSRVDLRVRAKRERSRRGFGVWGFGFRIGAKRVRSRRGYSG
jgi:hypothetical protein